MVKTCSIKNRRWTRAETIEIVTTLFNKTKIQLEKENLRKVLFQRDTNGHIKYEKNIKIVNFMNNNFSESFSTQNLMI